MSHNVTVRARPKRAENQLPSFSHAQSPNGGRESLDSVALYRSITATVCRRSSRCHNVITNPGSPLSDVSPHSSSPVLSQGIPHTSDGRSAKGLSSSISELVLDKMPKGEETTQFQTWPERTVRPLLLWAAARHPGTFTTVIDLS